MQLVDRVISEAKGSCDEQDEEAASIGEGIMLLMSFSQASRPLLLLDMQTASIC